MKFGKIFVLCLIVLGVGGYIFLRDKGREINQWKEKLSTSLIKDWKIPTMDETKAKLQLMMDQKQELEKKIQELTKSAEDKTNQTIDKAQKIKKSIDDTHAAYDQTLQSIQKLQNALQTTGKELGVQKE